jgi:hypothetical protein
MFQLKDDYDVSVNGLSVDRPAFAGMRGNVDLQFVEPRGTLHAIITLASSLRDREWFDTPDELCPFTPHVDDLAMVRSVTARILHTASAGRTCCRSRLRRFACRKTCCSRSMRCFVAAGRRNWPTGLPAGAIAASSA